MKKPYCAIISITILAAAMLISVVVISRVIKDKIDIAYQKTKVQKAEDAVWAAAAVMMMVNSDIHDACREDIYLPKEPPPSAEIECEKAKKETEPVITAARKSIRNLEQETMELARLQGK